jgi:transposase InsO family protein
VKRGPYAKVVARNAHLLERIMALKAEHPFWGYRRVRADLRYVDGLAVNQKRVYGTMKANGLLVKPNPKLRARRKADTRKPRPIRPNGWWGIDMTKVVDNGCQPTSLAFLRACAAMGIRQALTSYNNPKGNADTERFLRTLKEELVWLREWTSPAAFFQALDRWLADYNASYLHSARSATERRMRSRPSISATPLL